MLLAVRAARLSASSAQLVDKADVFTVAEVKNGHGPSKYVREAMVGDGVADGETVALYSGDALKDGASVTARRTASCP